MAPTNLCWHLENNIIIFHEKHIVLLTQNLLFILIQHWDTKSAFNISSIKFEWFSIFSRLFSNITSAGTVSLMRLLDLSSNWYKPKNFWHISFAMSGLFSSVSISYLKI